MGFPCGSAGKESTCNAGDLGSIPGLGRSLGEGKGYPLQYSGLENSVDFIVHGVAKNQTQLSDFHSLTHFLSKCWVAPAGALSCAIKSYLSIFCLSALPGVCVCVCNLKSCGFFQFSPLGAVLPECV